ncbi:MAG: hypothetical protein OEY59_02315 [Deltaproteobacteria bacterium]|nr:hypothetical protein [Deltaproteobacteria bacterium]
MDFTKQIDRLNWIKQRFKLKNQELAQLAAVHPSQVSNWLKPSDHRDYQDICKIRAVAISLGTEKDLKRENLHKRINWRWIAGWDSNHKRKRGEVDHELVNETNIWDPTLLDPGILEETISFIYKLKLKKGIHNIEPHIISKEIIQIYREVISEKINFASLEKIMNIGYNLPN